MSRRLLSIFCAGLLLTISPCAAVFSQPAITFTLDGDFCLPAGPNAGAFLYGGSGSLTGIYSLPSVAVLGLGGILDFAYIKQLGGASIYNMGILGAARLGLNLGTAVTLYSQLAAGGVLSLLESGYELTPYMNPAVEGMVGVDFIFQNAFGIGLHAGYDFHSLYNGFSFGVSARFGIGQYQSKTIELPPEIPLLANTELDAEEYLEVEVVQLADVFPVFFKHDDDHPLGMIELVNKGDVELTDISVSVFINKYMDLPKTTDVSGRILPGSHAEINVFALLNESVLEVQEPTKVGVRIEVDFKVAEKRKTLSKSATLRMLDRNALIWDDDMKAAAFVSSKDSSVMAIGKNVASMAADHAVGAVNTNIACAIGIQATLPHLGMRYVSDPRTPYEVLSQSTDVVDYVQYPKQTLYYRSGDCDDLSILYCSFFESIAINSAFITVPGHIFIAFSLGVSSEVAARSFIQADDLIIRDDGTVWIPVEVTMVESSFLEAWQKGAKQWREYNARGMAGFYPLQLAWQRYEPVGISGGVEGIQIPNSEAIRTDFIDEYNRYVSQGIYDWVAQFEDAIEKQGETPKLLNRLGILYASYGIYEKAKPYFENAVKDNEYGPALRNLGNIAYLESDFNSALAYFTRAFGIKPDDPHVLLSLARVNHELENYGTARKQYDRLREIDLVLAEKFAYLDYRDQNQARANNALTREVFWAEEGE
ncbi:MAG: hypothetical protein HN368_02095 [Spirochaetales bacterium]|nr:hypothetical protein [Spirochaetales bacterium]